MSGSFLGLLIESLVAVLLVLTIGYCMILNRRLGHLRADESSLRGTIAELVTATQIAERAIAGLQVTARETDTTLGERLRTAERFSAEFEKELKRGEEVLVHIRQIVDAASAAGRKAEPVNGVRTLNDTAAAAQAIAQRSRISANAA